uniref:Decapping nuclease n=1 Tax=Panagrolaimus sp. PS1159 TaxID=55785 RepID=A0AC35F4P4_9BILA
MANDNNNHRSGILMSKPSRFNAPETYFSTQFHDGYFTGQNHPIEFQPAFIKLLKPTYDKEETDVEIDLYSDASEFKFAVKKFRGIFFIKELETLSFLQRQKTCIPKNPLMFLTKFKHHLTSLLNDEYYDPPQEVCSWEQNQGLYQCELRKMSGSGGMKIFYGSEIDAMDKKYDFLEIKLIYGQLEPLDTFPNMVNIQYKWNPATCYSAPLSVISTVCEFYDKNVKEDETLVVELKPYTADLTYLICHDRVHTVLPKKFKNAFDNLGGGYVVQIGNGFMDGAVKKCARV